MSFVDAHCDTITRMFELDEALYKNKAHIDIERLARFAAPVQFFAVFLNPMYFADALPITLEYIDFYYEELKKNKEYISSAYCYDDILSNKKANKVSAVLALEGLYQIGRHLSLFNTFYKMGVRLCGLTWNYTNTLATGIRDIKKTGLTDQGFTAIEIMNELGIIIDVSHLSERSFWDVADASKEPFVASHSNAFSVTPNERNLTDSQIKQIAVCGGVIGINFHGAFLSGAGRPTLTDALLHIEHIINIGGEDVIALGSDFDGMENPPEELNDVTGHKALADAVLKRFGGTVHDKLTEKNMLRVMKDVWR